MNSSRGIRFLLIAMGLLSVVSSTAQEFFFHKKNYADSTSLANTLPDLARQVLDTVAESGKTLSYGTQMNLALLTEDFGSAIALVDSMRLNFEDDYKKGVYVPYEVYAKTKLKQDANTAFENAFETEFSQLYNALNVPSQSIVESNAQSSLENINAALQAQLTKARTSDTLQFSQALQLLGTYSFYRFYTQSLPTMKQVIREYNERTYLIESITLTMHDGAKIRAHVVRGKNQSSDLPTVFISNIYADSLGDIGKGKYYATEGYVCVVANTRGKGLNEGDIAPFEYDGQDAYDIIDWISKTDWSNGEVGMVGGSYLGFSQWAAVKKLHPSLKTIMPQVAVGPGIDYPMNGNVFMSYMLRWIHYVTANRTTDYSDFGNAEKWNGIYRKWYEQGRPFRSMDRIDGRPSAVFQRWLDHPSYDSFWQEMVPYQSEFSKIDIPILTTTGYFDDDQMGALYYYKNHLAFNPKANHYLVIGPYTHVGAQMYPDEEVGGYRVDVVATEVNFRRLSVEWFDFILKGENKPNILSNKVNFQVMGTNKWRHSASLSGMSNDTLAFYLSDSSNNEFRLLAEEPNDSFVEQTVDFKDRSDAVDFSFKVIKDSLGHELSNAIGFVSSPFSESVTISGSFIASLNLEINKKDLDIVIRAYEQMPDGRYFSLFTESGFSALQRASYTKNRSERQLLTPGKKETIPIHTSYVTSKKLGKGSRLVIILGVNKNPYWQINYGTGKDVSDETIDDADESLNIKWFEDSSFKIPILRNDM